MACHRHLKVPTPQQLLGQAGCHKGLRRGAERGESDMQVVELAAYGEPLQLVDRPQPEPGPGQVRVRVRAATVNPVDWLVAAGVLAQMTPHLSLPLVLGWDVVGDVVAVGEGVEFPEGQLVAAMLPWFATGEGAFAEAVVFDAGLAVPVPDGVDSVQAATVPLNGQTARQALDLLAPQPGQRVLVTGASGAVGGFVVQMAAGAGVRVVAVASVGDESRVRGLGAEQVLTRAGDVLALAREAAPDGFDGVLDAVPVGPQMIGAVRDGGAFVTVLDMTIPAAERGVRVEKVSASPKPEQLAELLQDLAAGRLVTSVAQQLPLADAGKALEVASGGGLRGKVVLVVPAG